MAGGALPPGYNETTHRKVRSTVSLGPTKSDTSQHQPSADRGAVESQRRGVSEEWGFTPGSSIPTDRAVVHVYAVSSWEGEPVNAALEEHTEVRWFGAGELPESEGLDAYRALVVTALG